MICGVQDPFTRETLWQAVDWLQSVSNNDITVVLSCHGGINRDGEHVAFFDDEHFVETSQILEDLGNKAKPGQKIDFIPIS